MPNAVLPKAAPADLVELGRISAAYGVKGWVKLQPHSTQAAVLLSARQWWLTPPLSETSPTAHTAAAPVLRKVVQARHQGATIVAQLEGMTDRDQAAAWRGWRVHVPRTEFPTLNEGEYYWVDLIGCNVYGRGESGLECMGIVTEVLDNGAHAILSVQRQYVAAAGPGSHLLMDTNHRPPAALVPFVHAHIERVDLDARRIDTNWPRDF